MNRKPNSTNGRSIWDLQHSPEPEPPTVESLNEVIRHRKQNRAIKSSAMIGATLIAGLGMMTWLDRHDNDPPADELVVRSGGVPNSPESSAFPATVHDHPESISQHVAATEQTQTQTDSAIGFKLYANIRAEAPVFHFDDQLGVMVPIGWVRFPDRVPVDLGPLSQDEVKTFETILRDEPPQYYF